jgi:HEPN domain-containing protein
MLKMAQKDLSAVENMKNSAAFADEIFGFHAQQAVEKSLKAWMSALGIVYPKIHDLEELLAILSENGKDTTPYLGLVDLNDFAVQFRYEAFADFENELNRESTIQQVTDLITAAERAVREG